MRGANWVGDAVMTVPALRELRRVLPARARRRWRRARGPKASSRAPTSSTTCSSPERRGARRARLLREAREWRARRFDLAVLFPNAFAPALVAFAARVPFARRLRDATGARRCSRTRCRVPAWRGARHEVFYYLNLVAELERMLHGASTRSSARAPTSRAWRFGRAPARRARLLLRDARRATANARSSRSVPARPTAARSAGPPSASPRVADMLIERDGRGRRCSSARREERDVSEEVARRMTRRARRC